MKEKTVSRISDQLAVLSDRIKVQLSFVKDYDIQPSSCKAQMLIIQLKMDEVLSMLHELVSKQDMMS